MNTKEIIREQVSALADGEVSHPQLDSVFATLRNADAKADWELYHRIGDALRADDVADAPLSAGFAARMSAALEAEPTIMAPAMHVAATKEAAAVAQSPARRWAIPGLAAAAGMAGIAFFTTPQLLVATSDNKPAITADAVVPAAQLASSGEKPEQGAVVATSVPDGVVLRDARMNEYLSAHQRFSPPLYSTAQYARSAAPATESSK